jgi:hypothetical protein
MTLSGKWIPEVRQKPAHIQMNSQRLKDTATAFFADNKGLLAMDESNCTCNKRLAELGIRQAVEARRPYRKLIVTTTITSWFINGSPRQFDVIIEYRRCSSLFHLLVPCGKSHRDKPSRIHRRTSATPPYTSVNANHYFHRRRR